MSNWKQNPALTTLILTLPKTTDFAELFKVIDPEGISIMRFFYAKIYSRKFKIFLLKTYNQIHFDRYQVVQSDIALRGVRNLCLNYLAYTHLGNNLVNKHYLYADNMTDTLAALTAATQAQLQYSEALMKDFEQKWQHDGLVMDKWFALQATSPNENVLQNVIQLMEHTSFNFNNPNQ